MTAAQRSKLAKRIKQLRKDRDAWRTRAIQIIEARRWKPPRLQRLHDAWIAVPQ